MPTAENAVVRIRGDDPQLWQLCMVRMYVDVPQLWQLCVHRRSNCFHEIEHEICSYSRFLKIKTYARMFDTNATDIAELHRNSLKCGLESGVWNSRVLKISYEI